MTNKQLRKHIKSLLNNSDEGKGGDWKEDVRRRLDRLQPYAQDAMDAERMYREHPSIMNGSRKQEAVDLFKNKLRQTIEEILVDYVKTVDPDELGEVIATWAFDLESQKGDYEGD